MKCFNCNSEVAENNTFCPLCGTNLVQNSNIESNNAENVQANNFDPNSFNVVSNPVDPLNSVQTVSNDVPNNVGVNSNNNFNIGFKETETKEFKSKSKTPFVIASILIVLVLAVGGVCGYLFMNSHKNVWSTMVEQSSNIFSGFVKSDLLKSNTFSTDFCFKTNIKTNDASVSSMLEILENISLNGKLQIDYQNKNIAVDLDSSYNDGELLNVNGYITNEKAYIYLEDLYDKYISANLEGINEIFEVDNSTDEILIVYDELMKAINVSLREEYMSSEKVNMTVNGSEGNINKNVLLLDDKNLTTFTKDILTILKSNDKFLESYSKVSVTEKTEIIDSMNEMLENLDSYFVSDSRIQLVLYTKGFNNEFVGFEYIQNLEDEEMNISIINDKKNTYTIKFIEDEEEVLTGYIEVNGNEYNFNFGDEELKFNGSVTLEKDGRVNLVLSALIEGEEIGFELSYLVKYDEVVTIPDLNNSISYESLSEEDTKNILTKATERPAIKSIIEEVGAMNSNSYSSYDSYDYGYGYDNSYEDYDYDYSYEYDYEF